MKRINLGIYSWLQKLSIIIYDLQAREPGELVIEGSLNLETLRAWIRAKEE